MDQTSVTCPVCRFAIPAPPAVQPVIDQLKFDNPQTLSATLRPGETVLAQAHAYLGCLVATDQRVMVIKRGQVSSFAYPDIVDVKVEKLNWMNAGCQIVTRSIPERKMKPKEAQEQAPNALAFAPNMQDVYRAVRTVILAVRTSYFCPACGSALAEPLRIAESPTNLDPLGFGLAGALAEALQPGEHLLYQAVPRRFAKSLVVTDQRVIIVGGKKPYVHPFAYSEIAGVRLGDDHLQLILKGTTPRELHGLAAVMADDAVRLDGDDRPKFEEAVRAIEEHLTPAITSG